MVTHFFRSTTIFSMLLALSPAAAQSGGSSSTGDSSGGGSSGGGGSGSGGSSGSGSVTINGGAGQLEGNLLSAAAINDAAVRICRIVPAETKNILVVAGSDRPDTSDWEVLHQSIGMLADQFSTTRSDFLEKHAAIEKVSIRTVTVRSHADRNHPQANGLNVGGVLKAVAVGLAPTHDAMLAFGSLVTIGTALSGSWEFGGAATTFSDYELGVAVASGLASGRDVVFANQVSVSDAARSLAKSLDGLRTAQLKAQRDVALGQSDIAKLADLSKKVTDKKDKAAFAELSAKMAANIANAQTALANYQSLMASLSQAPSPAAGAAASGGAKVSATAPDKTVAAPAASTTPSAATTASTSSGAPTLMAQILREKAIGDAMEGRSVLFLRIAMSWGGYYSRQNLLTFFGRTPLSAAGGAVVSYSLTDTTGKVVGAGLIPAGGDYIKATQVERRLKDKRALQVSGACAPGWSA